MKSNIWNFIFNWQTDKQPAILKASENIYVDKTVLIYFMNQQGYSYASQVFST